MGDQSFDWHGEIYLKISEFLFSRNYFQEVQVLPSDLTVREQILVNLIELYRSIENVPIYLSVSQNGSIGTLLEINDKNVTKDTCFNPAFKVNRLFPLCKSPYHPRIKSWQTTKTAPISQKTALPSSIKPAITACLVRGQKRILHELLIKNDTLKIRWSLNITSPEVF